jgi:hypothetical protein
MFNNDRIMVSDEWIFRDRDNISEIQRTIEFDRRFGATGVCVKRPDGLGMCTVMFANNPVREVYMDGNDFKVIKCSEVLELQLNIWHNVEKNFSGNDLFKWNLWNEIFDQYLYSKQDFPFEELINETALLKVDYDIKKLTSYANTNHDKIEKIINEQLVMSWDEYKIIHPDNSIEDYRLTAARVAQGFYTEEELRETAIPAIKSLFIDIIYWYIHGSDVPYENFNPYENREDAYISNELVKQIDSAISNHYRPENRMRAALYNIINEVSEKYAHTSFEYKEYLEPEDFWKDIRLSLTKIQESGHIGKTPEDVLPELKTQTPQKDKQFIKKTPEQYLSDIQGDARYIEAKNETRAISERKAER